MAKIILAEDESHMRRLLELTLRKAGHTWSAFTNGRDALEAARAGDPDCIILDVLMPVMDGLTALAELKRDPRTSAVPVIMLTARGQTLTRDQAEESGAAAFITKPFSPTELNSRIEQLTTATAAS